MMCMSLASGHFKEHRRPLAVLLCVIAAGAATAGASEWVSALDEQHVTRLTSCGVVSCSSIVRRVSQTDG